jgi:hypothetical protein
MSGLLAIKEAKRNKETYQSRNNETDSVSLNPET